MAMLMLHDLTDSQPFGKILPGATFATASVPLTQNYPDGIEQYVFSFVSIRANDENLQPLYLCNSAAAPDVTNYLNVIARLQPGETWPRDRGLTNSIDISRIWVGSAANATDFAIGCFSAL